MADVPGRRVGFLGLGLMGSRMARRFLVGGYTVTVFNRRPDKAQPLAKAGAAFADTPKLVVEKSDVILYSLADDAAVWEVVLGADGVLAGARRRRSKSTLSRTPGAGAARKTSRRSSERSRTCPASANRSRLTAGDGHDRVS